MAIVGLVSCAKRKKDAVCFAKDIYVSPLFKMSRVYVESRCDKWYILSAKYGLLNPDFMIAPYDETLKGKSKILLEQWRRGVCLDLDKVVYPGDTVLILAGGIYASGVWEFLMQKGCLVDLPMSGMSLGKRLKWLKTEIGRY